MLHEYSFQLTPSTQTRSSTEVGKPKAQSRGCKKKHWNIHKVNDWSYLPSTSPHCGQVAQPTNELKNQQDNHWFHDLNDTQRHIQDFDRTGAASWKGTHYVFEAAFCNKDGTHCDFSISKAGITVGCR